MSVREYIGARYVPMFADPITWDATRTYEPLTVVLYQGNSYTSRQAVPANIDISNTTYWAQTGNYNAQIEQYRQEVQTLDGRVTANTTAIGQNTTAIGQNATAISNETTNRQNADSALGTSISDEATARQNADTSLNAAITNVASLLPSTEFSSVNTVKNYVEKNRGNVLLYGGKQETYNLDWYQIFKDCYENEHGIYFPSGTYFIDSRVVLDSNTFYSDSLPFTISGDGAILRFIGTNTAIVNDASDGNGFCTVSGLIFADPYLNVDNALVNNKANGMNVKDCHFIGFNIAIKSTILGLVVNDCIFDGTFNSPPNGYGTPRGIAISATSDNIITGCKAFWLEMFAECTQSNIISNNYFYSPAHSIQTYFVGHRTGHIYASIITNNEIDTCLCAVLNPYTNVVFTNNVLLWDGSFTDEIVANKTAYIFAVNHNETVKNLVFNENAISEPDSTSWIVQQWGLLDSATSMQLLSYTSRDNQIFQRVNPENGTTRKMRLFCGLSTGEFHFEPNDYFKITALCPSGAIPYRFWPYTSPNMVLGGGRGIDNTDPWFTTLSIARYYYDANDGKSPNGYTNIALNSINNLTYSGPACFYEETGYSANAVVSTIPSGYTLRQNKQITWNVTTPTP